LTEKGVNVKIDFMLTKQDLQQVEEIVQRNIKSAFQEFIESIFEPYVARNENHHEQIVKEITAIKKDTVEIKGQLRNHQNRIERLEDIASIKN
jgi:hypothetical protein